MEDGYQPDGTAQKYFRMAQLYLRKHHTDKGLELLANALAADPLYEEARHALAAALRGAGRPDEATRLELAGVVSDEYCLVPRRNRSASQWQ
jgi:Tfp pilus assembly protein PilF